MHDYAEVAVKPPFLFAGAAVLGCLLSWLIPIGPGLGSANGRALAVGGSLALIGFALSVLSVREFRRAGTSVVSGDPSTMLVEAGPYRFTRNPIYIGIVIFYFGLSIVLTSAWMLLLLIPRLSSAETMLVMISAFCLAAVWADWSWVFTPPVRMAMSG